MQRLLARDAHLPLPEPLLLRWRRPSSIAASPRAATAALRAIAARRRAHDARGAPGAGRPPRPPSRSWSGSCSRDIDWPGARERHARWPRRLGRAATPLVRGQRGSPRIAAARRTRPFLVLREVGRGGSAPCTRPRTGSSAAASRSRSTISPTATAPSSFTRRASPSPSPGEGVVRVLRRRPGPRLAGDAVGAARGARLASAGRVRPSGWALRWRARSRACTRPAGCTTT